MTSAKHGLESAKLGPEGKSTWRQRNAPKLRDGPTPTTMPSERTSARCGPHHRRAASPRPHSPWTVTILIKLCAKTLDAPLATTISAGRNHTPQQPAPVGNGKHTTISVCVLEPHPWRCRCRLCGARYAAPTERRATRSPPRDRPRPPLCPARAARPCGRGGATSAIERTSPTAHPRLARVASTLCGPPLTCTCCPPKR